MNQNKEHYGEHYDLIDAHITKHFKEAKINVFHEKVTFDFHLDVYHIKPKNAEFELFMTSGMSSLAMNVSNVSQGSDKHRFAELMVLIPTGLNFGQIYPSGTKSDWIIGMLKASARFPHQYDTWIGIGHSIQADEVMKPYSKDTAFCGCLVLPTMTLAEDFKHVQSPHGVINIFSLFPMYKEELEFKIQHGFNEFMDFLIRNNTREIIDFTRTNYCKNGVFGRLKRKFGGWLKD